MKKIVKNTLALTLITIGAGLLLGIVMEITKEPIARQQEARKKEAYQAVFADAKDFQEESSFSPEDAQEVLSQEDLAGKDTINEVLRAMSESEEILGYVMNITSHEGYGGDITFSVGIRMDGTVNKIEILSISETAGLGMKANTEEFKEQFAQKQVEAFEYTKNGAAQDHQIDAISGATITSNAVVNGVNAGICYFRSLEKGGSSDE